eukprot:m.969852 g.969852  ORF g.969852 m.969852 type:complete len:63 (+) comp504882_c0_seq1:88-276(+)
MSRLIAIELQYMLNGSVSKFHTWSLRWVTLILLAMSTSIGELSFVGMYGSLFLLNVQYMTLM